ncbi:transcriptional repressor [Candidatus Dependentiae bacterium]|nr:transcriptional repressor [Candidatus Dependentiae bacterium]
MKIDEKELSRILRERNCKVTVPRIKILKYLLMNRVHPTAELIYREVKKELPKVSYATIYNNLNYFIENNLLKRIRLHKDYDIFDVGTHMHSHFICKKCNKVYDIPYEIHQPKKIKGHLITDMSVNFSGICKTCLKGKIKF